jgi:hypothetical protein
VIDEVKSLDSVPATSDVAVIINCGTKWATTLALASVLAHTDYPAIVINCESQDDSRRHFTRLASRYGFRFYWLEWPLRPHGRTIDAIFKSIAAETVLLVDSDAEIVDRLATDAMRAALTANHSAYGAGFLHGPAWLGAPQGLPDGVGYYAERMWVPLVLLRTLAIRHELGRGVSFAQERMFTELPNAPRLSRWLGYRFWVPGLRRVRSVAPFARMPDRASKAESIPAFVEFDTGARMHAALKAQGLAFASLDAALWPGVRHFHGITRARLPGRLHAAARRVGLARTDNAMAEGSAVSEIKHRLAQRYDIAAPDFSG